MGIVPRICPKSRVEGPDCAKMEQASPEIRENVKNGKTPLMNCTTTFDAIPPFSIDGPKS